MNSLIAYCVLLVVGCQMVAAVPVPYLVVDYIQAGYPISPFQRVRREAYAHPQYYPGGYGGYGGFQPGFGGGFDESQSSASSSSFSGGFGFGGFGGDISASQASAGSSSEGFYGKR